MFWLILAIICTGLFAYESVIKKYGIIICFASIIGWMAGPYMIVKGVWTYPDLLCQLKKIELLEKEKADIELINVAKSKYNQLLKEARFHKINRNSLIFKHGYFISDKIFELNYK